MQSILINVDTDTVKIVNPEGLEDWYKLMGVSLVDIAYRAIGKQHRYYNIICDDEGLLTDEPKISAVSLRRILSAMPMRRRSPPRMP